VGALRCLETFRNFCQQREAHREVLALEVFFEIDWTVRTGRINKSPAFQQSLTDDTTYTIIIDEDLWDRAKFSTEAHRVQRYTFFFFVELLRHIFHFVKTGQTLRLHHLLDGSVRLFGYTDEVIVVRKDGMFRIPDEAIQNALYSDPTREIGYVSIRGCE
jgi:hypothetical protein